MRLSHWIAALLLVASLASAEDGWVSKGAASPRKVVVATTLYSQYGDHPGLDARLDDAAALVDEAAREAGRLYPGRRLDLVVLTETILTASNAPAAKDRAVPLDGAVLDRMGGRARAHGTYLVVPLMLAETDGRTTNAAVLLDREGAVAGIYRKVHPVIDYGTDVVEGGVTPGSGFPVFETDFGRLGILICWDAVYDDGWEALARQGAEIVAFPSAAPHTVRPSAAALRGGYWVVSSTPLNNASIFNPLGMVHARITSGSVLVQEIDLSSAIVHWLPGLDEGRGLTARFGDRVGYVYYESEATGLFWSNDPATPISTMLAEMGFTEMAPYVERNRRAQDVARGRPVAASESAYNLERGRWIPGGATMIAGVNRIFEHEGKKFHIQVEDLGEEQAAFEIRVHSGGGIVWQKKMSYADTLAKKLARAEQDEAVGGAMEKALFTVEAAIARGKLP